MFKNKKSDHRLLINVDYFLDKWMLKENTFFLLKVFSPFRRII